ncbi:MAG: twin-arginine translocase TatA/TatE family subunit [Syntrophales bacterium]|jgi:sec-independent protein translocase protein TatA
MFSGIFRPMHLLVLLIVVLIIFGPGKLAELGGSLGKAIKGFKKEITGPDDERKQE